MTWNELTRNLKTPIIASNLANNSRVPIFIIPINKNRVYWHFLEETGILWGQECSTNSFEEFELLDWFGEFELTKSHVCNCDLFTVLIRSGCQCGGK